MEIQHTATPYISLGLICHPGFDRNITHFFGNFETSFVTISDYWVPNRWGYQRQACENTFFVD
jgi:hypothetical protein